jgi:hypothetical protein
MNIFDGFSLQLIIDCSLLVAVIILIWRINSIMKKPFVQSHKVMMKDIRTIMAESQTASENFLQALEKSRIALKEIAIELDMKEKRVKALLSKKDNNSVTNEVKNNSTTSEKRYHEVVDLVRRGYSEAQAAEMTGFSEAEIGLIIDLYRVKNENK